MDLYRIVNTISGLDLGVYEGNDTDEALDALAVASGYENFAESCLVAPVSPGELRVIAVAPPYPFCRSPAACAGKGYCPQDPACND